MIAWSLIVAAGLLTGIVAALSAVVAHWPLRSGVAAGVIACGLIVFWRAVANVAGLNGDFLPLVSIGDAGCLVAGATGPAALRLLARNPSRYRWLPAIAGGLAGFVINVVIL